VTDSPGLRDSEWGCCIQRAVPFFADRNATGACLHLRSSRRLAPPGGALIVKCAAAPPGPLNLRHLARWGGGMNRDLRVHTQLEATLPRRNRDIEGPASPPWPPAWARARAGSVPSCPPSPRFLGPAAAAALPSRRALCTAQGHHTSILSARPCNLKRSHTHTGPQAMARPLAQYRSVSSFKPSLLTSTF
jgi:hypothetical protein